MLLALWRKNYAESSPLYTETLSAYRDRGGRSKFFPGIFYSGLLTVFLALTSQSATADQKIYFEIPPQRADLSLTAFAQQSRLTLIIPYDVVKTVTTNALIGQFQIEDAIETLLDGTGLQATINKHKQLKISKNNSFEGVDMDK